MTKLMLEDDESDWKSLAHEFDARLIGPGAVPRRCLKRPPPSARMSASAFFFRLRREVPAPLRLGLPGFAALSPLPWLIASCLHDPNQFPRRAASPRPVAKPQTAGIEEQFVRWILSRRADESGPLPVYLISAEGGSLRRAYWTARVLAELNANQEHGSPDIHLHIPRCPEAASGSRRFWGLPARSPITAGERGKPGTKAR